MNVRVRFFASLRQLFNERERTLDLDPGTTVMGLLGRLADSEDRRRELFEGEKVNPHLVIIRNGQPVHSREGLVSTLQEGDVLNLFPFLGGG